MARDLSLYDSPELSLTAVQGGLAHPPGQPLHTWLGWVAAHLPGVPPLIGLNALSALGGALCALSAYSLAESLAPVQGRRAWAAGVVLWLFGTHPALWEPATRVEVYALACGLALWAAARLAAICGEDHRDRPAWRALFVPGLALGLAASANPYLAAFVALGALPRLTARWRAGLLPKMAPLGAIAGGALGLLPYAHVWLVAGRTDAFVWGAPTDWPSLVHYFRGLDYARNREIGAATILAHAGEWFPWARERGVLLPFALAAVALAPRARRGLGAAFGPVVFGLGLLVFCANAVWTPDVPDYLSYLLPALWFLAAGAAASVSAAWGRGGPWLAAVAAGACLLAPPTPLERTRHRDRVARLFADGVLAEAPRDALVITGADHLVAPLLYLQGAEGRRPDVVLLAYGLAASSWHWQQLYASHPTLRPFALRGPGARDGRVARFIAAHPERPVLVEDPAMAARLGLSVCPGRWLWRARMPCAQGAALLDAARALAAARAQLGRGAPSALGALAQVSLTRGLGLWRLGHPDAALHTLLAVVDPAHVGGDLPTVSSAAPLRRQPPAWARPADLGDPARNLFMAAQLAYAAGAHERAAAWVSACARLGLPEAQREAAARE